MPPKQRPQDSENSRENNDSAGLSELFQDLRDQGYSITAEEEAGLRQQVVVRAFNLYLNMLSSQEGFTGTIPHADGYPVTGQPTDGAGRTFSRAMAYQYPGVPVDIRLVNQPVSSEGQLHLIDYQVGGSSAFVDEVDHMMGASSAQPTAGHLFPIIYEWEMVPSQQVATAQRFFQPSALPTEGRNAKRLAALNYQDEVPDEYVCPLSLCIMTQPVRVKTQHNIRFEKTWILKSLMSKMINPCTGRPLTAADLEDDTDLKNEINTFITGLEDEEVYRAELAHYSIP